MSTITGRCDVCNEVYDGEDLTRNLDGQDLCTRCELEQDLADAKERYTNLQDWLVNTHLKTMRETKEEIDALEKKLKIIEDDRKIEPLKI